MRESVQPRLPQRSLFHDWPQCPPGRAACSTKRRDRPPEISRAAGRPPGATQSRGAARTLRDPPPIGAGDLPGHPSDDGPLTNTTFRAAGWSDGTPRRLAGAVTDVAQRSLPHSRHDTPSPGWESGVWVRIQRRRRYQRLGALVLALGAAGVAVPSWPATASSVRRQRSVSRRRSRARSGRTEALRSTSAGGSPTTGPSSGSTGTRSARCSGVRALRSAPSRPPAAAADPPGGRGRRVPSRGLLPPRPRPRRDDAAGPGRGARPAATRSRCPLPRRLLSPARLEVVVHPR